MANMKKDRHQSAMGPKASIWNVVDVADFFGMSAYTLRRIYNAIERGVRRELRKGELDFSKLPRFRVGGMWRWFADDVREFARKGAVANG